MTDNKKISLNSAAPNNHSPLSMWTPPQVDCPKHGLTSNFISSTIKGYEGHWCQICWIETLGPSLPLVKSAPTHD